jgi:biotin transport system substrate-specific component
MSVAQTRVAVANPYKTLADDVSLVVIGSALMALCAHVSLPLLFNPVPLTLQTFGVMVIALTLGANRGAAALALYLLEGAAGLPVFSPAGPGGIAQIIGPTGGFLMSYPLVAYVIGKTFEKGREFKYAQLASVCGAIVFLTGGMAWLKIVTHVTFAKAFTLAVAPFIAGEVIKIFAASYVGLRANKLLVQYQL